MDSDTSIFIEAFHLITSLNNNLFEIIFISLKVSLTAVLLSCLISIPLATLKSTVAASADFADFKSRIAAL